MTFFFIFVIMHAIGVELWKRYFNIVDNGKIKNANTTMSNLRLKRTENWESGVLEEHIWGTFDLVVYTVILERLLYLFQNELEVGYQ